MFTRACILAVLASTVSLAGCNSPTHTVDEDACPVPSGQGYYGCARIVLIVGPPPQPWPERYRWSIRATPAREGTGADVALADQPKPGTVPITIMRWLPPARGTGDTASVWVSAKMLEDPRSFPTGVPLPVFAADSALRVVRFAAVGTVPQTDTVQLTLRRP
jgi:hypothetical protein